METEIDYSHFAENINKARNEADGLSRRELRDIKKMAVGKTSRSCAICLKSFLKGDIIRKLPCKHIFHAEECVDAWLTSCPCCPLCRINVRKHLPD